MVRNLPIGYLGAWYHVGSRESIDADDTVSVIVERMDPRPVNSRSDPPYSRTLADEKTPAK